MTKQDRMCDGKNCGNNFEDGETYMYMENDPDRIYCSSGCLFSKIGEPYRYGTIVGDEEV
jgi:hypothetical protein